MAAQALYCVRQNRFVIRSGQGGLNVAEVMMLGQELTKLGPKGECAQYGTTLLYQVMGHGHPTL